MDLSGFPDAGDVRRLRVLERTIAGGERGEVTRCVIEVEYASGGHRVAEVTFSHETAMSLATFEAMIEELNKALARYG